MDYGPGPLELDPRGPSPVDSCLRPPHLDEELIESHDGSEVEEGEVEVVLEQLQEAEVALPPLAVLQGETHAPHDGEATTTIEKDVAKLKVPRHKASLQCINSNRVGAGYLHCTFIEEG